jgi:hypothetical protein
MPDEHWKRELLRLTNPRVYPFEEKIVLVESLEGQLHLNTQTVESRPVEQPTSPRARSIFEHQGEVLVLDAAASLVIDGFRRFMRVHQIGKAGFFREDYDALKQAEWIWDEASDLSSSDQFAAIDSHYTFAGAGLLQAVPILLDLISLGDRDVSEPAVRSLNAFFFHAGHRCFSREELAALRGAAAQVRQALGNTNDPDIKTLMHDALDTFADQQHRGIL